MTSTPLLSGRSRRPGIPACENSLAACAQGNQQRTEGHGVAPTRTTCVNQATVARKPAYGTVNY